MKTLLVLAIALAVLASTGRREPPTTPDQVFTGPRVFMTTPKQFAILVQDADAYHLQRMMGDTVVFVTDVAADSLLRIECRGVHHYWILGCNTLRVHVHRFDQLEANVGRN